MIFIGYEWLYTFPKILHRDISLNNLMFRRKNGKIFGVLNDFDLSVFRDNITSSSKQRTGTKPYLALDLLNKGGYEHKYRHDLESFLYVIAWITSRYHEGAEIPDPPFQKWVQGSEEDLRGMKFEFIHEIGPDPTPHFKMFQWWVESMQSAFASGLSARKTYQRRLRFATDEQTPFDDETLGVMWFSTYFERSSILMSKALIFFLSAIHWIAL